MTDSPPGAYAPPGGDSAARDGPEASWSLPRRLFVHNLPYNSTEQDLLDLLSAAGEIVSVRRLFEFSGRFRGMALVQYATQEATEHAITQFNGFDFKGRRLWVEYTTQTDGPPPRKRGRSPPRYRQDGPYPVKAPPAPPLPPPYAALPPYGYPVYPYDPSTYYRDAYQLYYQQAVYGAQPPPPQGKPPDADSSFRPY
jgi:RNA recognition motif-containing protein